MLHIHNTSAGSDARKPRFCSANAAASFPSRRVHVRAAASDLATLPQGGRPPRQPPAVMRVIEDGKISEKPIPDGRFSWPVWGETSDMLDKGYLRFGLEHMLDYGTIFRTAFFGMDMIMVTDPEAYKSVMMEDSKLVKFDMGGAFAKVMGEFNMNILSNKDGARMPFRKAMLAAVTQEAMAGYIPKMLSIAEAQVAYLTTQPEFEINVEARKWGMAYANALLAGIKTNGEADEEHLRNELAIYFEGVMTFDIDLPGTTLRKSLDARSRLIVRIKESIHDQMTEILKEINTKITNTGHKVRKNMLGYVIANARDEGTELSEDFLANMAMSLLQAGTDTSSAGFAGLCAILAKRRDVMARIREEQRSIISTHGPAIDKVCMDNSKYLDAAVREGVRLNPPGVAQYRRTQQEIELLGYRIPKGTMMSFNIPAMQAVEVDPEWLGRARAQVAAGQPMPMPVGIGIQDIANDYDPNRWLVSDPAQRPSLFTFGHGPHTCLGIGLYVQEAKVLLAKLVRSHDLELLTQDFTWTEMPAVKPGDGVKMRLVPIDNPLV